ncbi:MAG: hypothetical protein ABIO70_19655 [Pseudomonadota bacterium]
MRYLPALLGWLVVVTVVSLLVMAQLSRDQEAPGSRELYYAVAPGQEVDIRLLADEPRLRIMAHLEAPDPGVADEATTWLYGLKLILTPSDGAPITREHWTRSRRTILPDGSPALLAARHDRVVTDSRIIEIEPAHLLPAGGTLTLQPLLERPDQRLLLRVYRERPTQLLEETRLLGSPEKRQVRTEGVYPFPWDALEPAEQEHVMGWIRERLHAESQTAESVPMHRLGSPSPAPTHPSTGWRLDPGQATAITLRGPCTLNVATELAEPEPGEETKGLPLETSLVDASPRPRPVDADALSAFRWEVPDGALWSIRWSNPWEKPAVAMRFSVSPPAGHSWGEPPGAGGEEPQTPERRRLAHFRADQGLGPVVIPVASGTDWGSLRVDARPLPPEAWLTPVLDGGAPPADLTPAPVRVRYTAYDTDGQALGAGSFEAAFSYSPFERYVEGEQPWVSEETEVHLFHPFNATTLEFTADAPVDLRFLVPLQVEPVRAPEYSLPEGWTGRYAPWELAPYVSLSPLNVQELIEEHRLDRIDATVRIEPSRRRARGESRHTALLEPNGNLPAYPLAERFHSGAPWKSWHRTRLDGPTEIEIPAGGTLTVDYRVDSPAAGQLVDLACAGVGLRLPLTASAGLLRFGGLPAGRQPCTLRAPAGEFLARAPGSGERWTRRTVFRGDNTTLTLPVEVVHGDSTIVYVRAYSVDSTHAPVLHTVLDDGHARRHGGPSQQFTRADRSVTLERTGSTGRLEDRDAGLLTAWEGVRLELGDDLVAGTHQITVQVEQPEGAFGPVFLRFETNRGSEEPELPEHWAQEVKCALAR